jgi:hypothetical protein
VHQAIAASHEEFAVLVRNVHLKPCAECYDYLLEGYAIEPLDVSIRNCTLCVAQAVLFSSTAFSAFFIAGTIARN